jgi:hypothetical protein
MHSSHARGQILCKNNGRIGTIERGRVQGFETVLLIEPQSSCIVSYDGSQNGAEAILPGPMEYSAQEVIGYPTVPVFGGYPHLQQFSRIGFSFNDTSFQLPWNFAAKSSIESTSAAGGAHELTRRDKSTIHTYRMISPFIHDRQEKFRHHSLLNCRSANASSELFQIILLQSYHRNRYW